MRLTATAGGADTACGGIREVHHRDTIPDVRTRVVVAATAVALFLGGGTGCRSCDGMGCTDSLRVTSTSLRADQTVEVCVDKSCVLAAPAGGVTFTQLLTLAPGNAEVTVVIRERGAVVAQQRRLVAVADFRPNGDRCPPSCKVVDVPVGDRGFA